MTFLVDSTKSFDGLGMVGIRVGIFSLVLFSIVSISSAFAHGVAASHCFDLVEKVKAEPDLHQSHIVRLPNGKTYHFGNAQLAKILKDGPTPEAIKLATAYVQSKGAMNLELDRDGDVLASTVGDYRAVWARDAAVTIAGLTRDQQRIAIPRFLRVQGNPRNLELYFLNLRTTYLHTISNPDVFRREVESRWNPRFRNIPMSPANFVPQIKHSKDEIADPAFWSDNPPDLPVQGWNHKQNDAQALAFIGPASALERGIIHWNDLDDYGKAVLPLILAYGIRVKFHDKHDAGAWEEADGRRTTSIGQFADALWRFRKHMLRDSIRFHLKGNPKIPADIYAILDEALRPESITEAFEHGRRVVRDQIHRGEVPDYFNEHARQAQRFSDAAFGNLLYLTPEWLDESDYQAIFRHLENLKRPMGTIRYVGDVYLTLGQFYPRHLRLPSAMVLGSDPVTAGELDEAFQRKDPDFVHRILGPDQEAQWSLADLQKMVALPVLIQRFKDSPQSQFYREELEDSVMRSFSHFTGEGAEGQGPYGMDGNRVPAVSLGEGWKRVVLHGEGGVEYRVASKYTPLNWAKSLFIQGIESLYGYYRDQGLDFPADPFHRQLSVLAGIGEHP